MVGARFATVGILEDDGVTLRHFFTSGFDRTEAVESGVPEDCHAFSIGGSRAPVRSVFPGRTGCVFRRNRLSSNRSSARHPAARPSGGSLRVALSAEKIGAPAFSEATSASPSR